MYTCTRVCSLITICEVVVTKCQMITGLHYKRASCVDSSSYKHRVEETNINSFFSTFDAFFVAFSALTLLVGLGGRKGIRPVKKYGGWWRWVLVSSDRLAPSRMISVSAAVNLPLHNKIQKFSSGTGSPGWSRKKGCKTAVVVVIQIKN